MTTARRCVALLSGGLDSMLAIRIVQDQGIEVEAISFNSVFTCCKDRAHRAACYLGVRLTIVGQEDDYLDLIRRPQFGYGKGANPCIDCRIYMVRRAARFMQQIGADFVVSGEVLGQRPMSQKRRDLAIIAYHSGIEDLLLRPLSAMYLPITLPEREGWVDRKKLYNFHGRGRKGLIRLARRLGLKEIPPPSTGCALTEPRFSQNVFDLIRIDPTAQRWDFELLKIGRHFRYDNRTKVVVGRREAENAALHSMHKLPDASSTALMVPGNFTGPAALVTGPPTEAALQFGAGLIFRHSKCRDPHAAQVRCFQQDEQRPIRPALSEEVRNARTLASSLDD